MTRREVEERLRFETIMKDEAEALNHGALPLWTRRQKGEIAARLLCRHGKTYVRIQEASCNGVGTWYGESNESFQKRQERHERWIEKREQQLEKRMREIVRDLGPGFDVLFSGDPRGTTVKVVVPSGKTNDWGKEGICVPTA